MNYFLTSTLLVCISTASFAHGIRVTETSITENGSLRFEGAPALKTKGFGLQYSYSGYGVSITKLQTTGDNQVAKVVMDHSYIDASYTYGEDWLGTFGTGLGASGKISIDDESSQSFKASSWHLGVGYRYAGIELYWINRLNFIRYEIQGTNIYLNSTHYQLGIGYQFQPQ